jgi:hypothetical protein
LAVAVVVTPVLAGVAGLRVTVRQKSQPQRGCIRIRHGGFNQGCFHFRSVTRRSPMASGNTVLNDEIPLGFFRATPFAPFVQSKPPLAGSLQPATLAHGAVGRATPCAPSW